MYTNIMCPIVPDDCEEPICGGNGVNVTNFADNTKADDVGNVDVGNGPLAQARAFEPRADALLQPAEDGALMASYSVFVVEPGASALGKCIFFFVKMVSRKKYESIFLQFKSADFWSTRICSHGQMSM